MDPSKVTAELLGTVAKSRLLHRVIAVVIVLQLVGAAVIFLGPSALGALVGSRQITRQQAIASNNSCPVGLDSTGTNVAVPSLNRDQITLAHTIWQVARQVGVGDKGATIAIATAMQESTLGSDQTTRKRNNDGDISDFQQRSDLGWYAPGTTVPENDRILLDPVTGARTFFLGHTVTAPAWDAAKAAGTTPAGPVGYHIPGLVDIPGWDAMPLTQAAQKVQRSAYPTAYAKHEQRAAQLVQRFAVEGGPGSASNTAMMAAPNPALCSNGNAAAMNCPDSGLPVERGLTPDAVRVVRCVKQQFPQISSIGGIGDRPSNVDDDHQTGRAVDVMVPGRCDVLGDQVRDYVFSKQRELGVTYIIWCDKIWSVARNSEGWRPYVNPNGSGDTHRHRDHVHVSVEGNAAGQPAPGAGPTGATVTPIQPYVLTATFGQCSARWKACHTGLDFAAGTGIPIKAVSDGTVTSVGWGGAYGNLTRIDHGGGIETWYAHQSATTAQVGQRVTAGQTIGAVGATGNVSGPHVHLEVRINGTPTDPAPWLRSRGVKL